MRTLHYLRQRRSDINHEAQKQINYFLDDIEPVKELFDGRLSGLRALDAGCGNMLPATIGLAGLGCKVTGIDIDPYVPGKTFASFRRRWQEDGPKRALAQTARNLIADIPVQRKIARGFPNPVHLGALDIRVMDAAEQTFPDDTFDIVYSSAVFEHIEDVPTVLREVHRVLKPGGVARLHAHLFASYTGGHNREMLDEAGSPLPVEPWDHLRRNNYPANCYLNKLREKDFRRMVEESPLEIVGWILSPPGPAELEALTSEIEAELAAKGYTRVELLTTNLSMITRKPAPQQRTPKAASADNKPAEKEGLAKVNG